MMYQTHVKVGKTFYILGINILIGLGLLPNLFEKIKSGGIKEIVSSIGVFAILSCIGWYGSIWGAGYNDIDSKNSIPRKNNETIGKWFDKFGVKHRGKFTHSLDMVTLTYLIVFVVGTLIINIVFTNSSGFSVEEGIGKFILGAYQVWVASAYIGSVSHLVADTPTKGGVRVLFFLPRIRLIVTENTLYVLSLVVMVVMRVIDINGIMGGDIVKLLSAFLFMIISKTIIKVVYRRKKEEVKNKTLVLIASLIAYFMLEEILIRVGIQNLIYLKSILQVILICITLVILLPHEDYFVTGNDSEWEKRVNESFKYLFPGSVVITVILMIM